MPIGRAVGLTPLPTGSEAGAEAVCGLGRAFFYAGSRALLVTNWAVMSDAAIALTTDTFRRQSADPRLRGLRRYVRPCWD